MTKFANTLNTLRTLPSGAKRFYYSLPALGEQGDFRLHRLPISIRIMLESLLRNCDGVRVQESDVLRLAHWHKQEHQGEIPFVVARVILQDFTGVPLLVDLAAMRDAMASHGGAAEDIEPEVPVDLVVDHSVQVDRSGTSDAFLTNLRIEFQRNQERYTFLKWGEEAFKTFKVVPPGIGIVHQVNLEHLATVVVESEKEGDTLLYLDTLVGTDSHTTMINGLGIVGWGVGGIEAQAAMLGQPVTLQIPEVIGVHLTGKLLEGVTATDLALYITELLRKENVVGKFVEFFGEGTCSLTVADRSTVANMAPEYGATMGFFPVDEKTLEYLRMTGREEKNITEIREYLQAQELFGIPKKGDIDFTKILDLNLSEILPSVAGPKRPQDRINLSELKSEFLSTLIGPLGSQGYGKIEEDLDAGIYIHTGKKFSKSKHHDSGGIDKISSRATMNEAEMVTNRPFTEPVIHPGYTHKQPYNGFLAHGSVVIAAITSCTNTSNPSVMIAAGLLAKKAMEKGLSMNPFVKASLAPGSRVVTEYLEKTGLQKYLDHFGFQLVAYGCTTCIGNSGPLDEKIENTIKEHDLVVASVLSGNRNFEARIHSAVKANFLMSPPLVVAFAIAGRVDIDMDKEPLGYNDSGEAVYLKDVWPTSQEIQKSIKDHIGPRMFRTRYANILNDNPIWRDIEVRGGAQYLWQNESTYIQKPPYFADFTMKLPPKKELHGMSCLALFGDSVTTDHISPAGAFHVDSPAGKYLTSLGVKLSDFNSYGSRRGNHHIMMRGTFANVRIKNKMAGGQEGGFTKLMPESTLMSIFEASQIYAARKTPLIIFAGQDYGMGSSRDWAAKGTLLLGVRVVIAQSFERIHRSNLIGMGVLPLEFKEGDNFESLGIEGHEVFSILGLNEAIEPGQDLSLEIISHGKKQIKQVTLRLDTLMEIEYYKHGGIMPYVLRQIISRQKNR